MLSRPLPQCGVKLAVSAEAANLWDVFAEVQQAEETGPVWFSSFV